MILELQNYFQFNPIARAKCYLFITKYQQLILVNKEEEVKKIFFSLLVEGIMFFFFFCTFEKMAKLGLMRTHNTITCGWVWLNGSLVRNPM